jgi:hypothetical protein
VLDLVIERFAARTGMVIVRPFGKTPWSPRVSCLLANPVFLVYIREESELVPYENEDAFDFEMDDVDDYERPINLTPEHNLVTMLAPTFAPEHWFELTEVIREQDDRWSPDWTPPFGGSIEGQLAEVERRLDHLREVFSPGNFLDFSTRVRSGHFEMRGKS